MPQLEYVIKGCKKSSVRPPHRCLPITPDILVVLKTFLGIISRSVQCSSILGSIMYVLFCFLGMGKVVTPIAHSYDPNTIAECTCTSVIIALFISTLGLGEG